MIYLPDNSEIKIENYHPVYLIQHFKHQHSDCRHFWIWFNVSMNDLIFHQKKKKKNADKKIIRKSFSWVRLTHRQDWNFLAYKSCCCCCSYRWLFLIFSLSVVCCWWYHHHHHVCHLDYLWLNNWKKLKLLQWSYFFYKKNTLRIFVVVFVVTKKKFPVWWLCLCWQNILAFCFVCLNIQVKFRWKIAEDFFEEIFFFFEITGLTHETNSKTLNQLKERVDN